ncbi:MAG: hypothetical protein HFI30_02850 [Lachnospiraceae bacterium]|jgi:hypothetical protein|nr:hypothetical protein [Lachnospiraceae bacterium]
MMKKNLGRTLCAAVISFLLALGVLGIKNEYARYLPGGSYGMKPLVETGGAKHVFIGSSMFRQGLDIRVLEEELGDSVYILSYNGNQPLFMAMELSYLLDQGVEISHLYVDLYGYTAASSPWISDTKILLDTDLDFKWATWDQMKEYNHTSLLDFYELFVTANNEQLLTWPVHSRLLASQFYKGGTLVYSGGTTREALDYSLGEREGVHPAQEAGYKEIIRLAREQDISLTFIETPKYASMEGDETYTKLVSQCLKAVEGAPVVLAREVEFDNTDPCSFQDLIHLSSQGREEYTRELCRAILSGETRIEEE